MKIFLTGGTGFIGSHLAWNLVRGGNDVTIIARNPGKIPAFRTMAGIRIVEGTLHDRNIILNAMTGCDACIHVALGWGNTAVEMMRNDTAPSISLFECAVDAGVRHIIYTSSVAAVGDFRPRMDATSVTRPNDFYGATKAATECYLLAMAAKFPVRCNIIRPTYTFGNPVVPGAPIQPDRRCIDIVRAALRNEPINLIEHDGTQFIGVEDLVRIYCKVLLSEYNRTVFFGVGSGYITWEELARFVINVTGSKSIIMLENRRWEPGVYQYDHSAAEHLFGASFPTIERLHNHLEFISETEKNLL